MAKKISTNVSDSLKTAIDELGKETGVTQAHIVEEALTRYLEMVNSPVTQARGFLPDTETKQTYFASVNGEKREKLLAGLETHNASPEMTEAELLQLACKVSGRDANSIISDGVSYSAQRIIGSELASSGKQGALGSADTKIIESINANRELVSNGRYKPHANKEGKYLIPVSNVAGLALTGVPTVKGFFNRKPEYLALLDVTDLI
jgi:hypothetical protein